MFTWHHGFWIYFLTRHHPMVWYFLLGSMLPDYIYIIAIVFMLLHGQLSWIDLLHLDPAIMMSLLPMYPWVVKIDLIGHSVIVWGIVFITALLIQIKGAQAFVIGWGTHLLIDSLTHAAYGNYLLYPLSLFSVHSPVSYWEIQYFANEFNWINRILMSLAVLYLLCEWLRKKKRQ